MVSDTVSRVRCRSFMSFLDGYLSLIVDLADLFFCV